MLVVLAVAANWGLLESTVTSILAILCLNFYFLPPILRVTIADPQNWVALFGFMATAITASQLSGRARKRTLEAKTRQAELERLYALSCSLSMLSGQNEAGVQIVHLVKQHFGCGAVAFCNAIDGEINYAGTPTGQLGAIHLREVASCENHQTVRQEKSDAGDKCVLTALTLGGRVLGSLGAVGPPISAPAWQAVAHLVGITVERLRSQAVASRIEAARQSELLKSLLLDALAHDFVTPLTAIKGAITTVRFEYHHDSEEDDLLAVVEEEADKLNGMVVETNEMTRIESGRLQLRRRRLPAADLIQACLNRMSGRLDGRSAAIRLPADVPDVSADPDFAALALKQLISNAVKYSPPRSKIQISGSLANDMVMIKVRDEGPGIPPDEVDAIFDRYYRGSEAPVSVPGTGMGLAIARDIVTAHGGRIWVNNSADGGAEFAFTLPIATCEEPV